MKHFLFAALAASLAVPSFAHGDKICKSCPMGKTVAKSAPAKLAKGEKIATFSVAKMHCGGCAQGVKAALAKVNGVKSVSADPQTKLVAITYVSAKQSPKTLGAALSKAGFPAKEAKAATAKTRCETADCADGEKL